MRPPAPQNEVCIACRPGECGKQKDGWSWMSCKPLVSLKFKKDSAELEEDAIGQAFKECLEKLPEYEKSLTEKIRLSER